MHDLGANQIRNHLARFGNSRAEKMLRKKLNFKKLQKRGTA
jgi:hypothetical protein